MSGPATGTHHLTRPPGAGPSPGTPGRSARAPARTLRGVPAALQHAQDAGRPITHPSKTAFDTSHLGHIPGVSVALNRQGDNYPPPFTAANPPPWGDSDPAAQISWGLGYIAVSYTTPCGAWAHEEADGFY